MPGHALTFSPVAIGPKTLIPIRTFEPVGFKRYSDNVLALADGDAYEF